MVVEGRRGLGVVLWEGVWGEGGGLGVLLWGGRGRAEVLPTQQGVGQGMVAQTIPCPRGANPLSFLF